MKKTGTSVNVKRKTPVESAGKSGGSASTTVLYKRIYDILNFARTTISRSVNSTQVVANWLVGREIVENEQRGKYKAGYGERILKELSVLLSKEFGNGYSGTNLRWFRQFYFEYPSLLNQMYHAPRDTSTESNQFPGSMGIYHAMRDKSNTMAPREIADSFLQDWKSGFLNPNLSWTHYRLLLKVRSSDARSFYEIETINSGWSSRQLERQIDSLLFERLLKSRDKKGVIALANKGLEITKPIDIIKDPVVLEFLDLPESHRLVETKVEEALISKLKEFLLELGSGFAFVGRQKRLTLEGDHFYPDLVFYHIRLKCYCIIDLKTQKLNHGDLGQMLMYVNYYDKEIKTKEDNPTIGLILCTDKNDAVAEYVLDEKKKQIFASRYQYELPTIEELQQELRHEMELLSPELPPVKSVQRTSTPRKKSGSIAKKEKRSVK